LYLSRGYLEFKMNKRRSLIANTLIVASGTLLSRFVGLWREILLSATFGASWITDAFLLAYTIPNLLRRLFAEGALGTSVVPVFSEYQGREKEDVFTFLSAVFTGLTAIVALLCGLGILFAPQIVRFVAWGFRGDPGKLALTIDFTRLMFPFLLLISWSAFLMGSLNTLHVFSWSALAPVFFNLGMIGSLLFLRKWVDVYSLALGVLIGGMGQFLFQLFPFYRLGLRLRLHFRFWREPGFRKVVRLMLPVTFALAVSQLNTLVDRLIASTCREGAVSALYFADRLMELPLGVFGVAISTVILPSLSQSIQEEKVEKWQDTLLEGFRLVIFVMLPITVFLMLFRGDLVKMVYQRGVFGFEATSMTSEALLFYALGLPAFSLVHLFTRAFYSLQDTYTPVKIGMLVVGCNVILDFILARFMGFSGLALATSLCALLNFLLLGFLLNRSQPLNMSDTGNWWWKLALQITAFVFFAYFLWKTLGHTFDASRIGVLVVIIFMLALFYVFLTIGLKMEEKKTVVLIFERFYNKFVKGTKRDE